LGEPGTSTGGEPVERGGAKGGNAHGHDKGRTMSGGGTGGGKKKNTKKDFKVTAEGF